MRDHSEIAKDNDTFRRTLIVSPRHKVVVTAGVSALQEQHPEHYQELITKVREFKQFISDPNDDRQNDPYGEHDFGMVEVSGEKYYWKIDYYDFDFEFGLDPHEEPTALVLTLLRTDEY